MKRCSKCGEEKPKHEYTKRVASPDGLNSACKPCLRGYKKALYDADSGVRAYYKEKSKRVERARKESDPGWRRMWNAWHYAKSINRVPGWISTQDVLPIYRQAAALGDDFVVDHEIPLRGEYVSGLHVPSNLQILTAGTNTAKGNKHPYPLFLEL